MLNEIEQKLVAEAVKKILEKAGVDHQVVAGFAPAQLVAVAKAVCEVASVICPIVNKL